jgi:hypothetical protein
MLFRIANWMLIPVLTMTIACSLANAGMDSPAMARKMSAPCPFHPEPPATEKSPEKPKCLNCLTNSVRMEDRHEVQPNFHVNFAVPQPLATVAFFDMATSVSAWKLPSLALESPPLIAVPLRV